MLLLEKQKGSQLLRGKIMSAQYNFWKYPYNHNLLNEFGKEFAEGDQLEVDEELESCRPLIQEEKGKRGLYALGTKISIGTEDLQWYCSQSSKHPDVIVLYPNKYILL